MGAMVLLQEEFSFVFINGYYVNHGNGFSYVETERLEIAIPIVDPTVGDVLEAIKDRLVSRPIYKGYLVNYLYLIDGIADATFLNTDMKVSKYDIRSGHRFGVGSTVR